MFLYFLKKIIPFLRFSCLFLSIKNFFLTWSLHPLLVVLIARKIRDIKGVKKNWNCKLLRQKTSVRLDMSYTCIVTHMNGDIEALCREKRGTSDQTNCSQRLWLQRLHLGVDIPMCYLLSLAAWCMPNSCFTGWICVWVMLMPALVWH